MYYHVTTSKNAENILKEGLKPTIGPNSQLNHENEKFIYLCGRKDIKFWRIILGNYTVLEIDDEAIKEFYSFEYTDYSEIYINYPIEPKFIKRINISSNETLQMKKLCLNFLHMVSAYCVMCAKYYTYKEDYDENDEYIKDIKNEVSTGSEFLRKMLPRLDYSVLSKKEITDYIKQMGNDCAYTICDKYCDEPKRLYQKLIEYETDETTDDRKFIHNYIKKYLKGCLSVDTGGWCE